MEKSIENIWKNGFEMDKDLIAPKVSNLYNRKSQQLVAKLMRAFRMETKMLIPLSLAFLIFNSLIGNNFWHGIPVLIWCVAWYFIAKKQLQKIENVDTNLNCYDYLKQFQENVLHAFKTYEKILLIGVPLLLSPLLVFTYYNNIDKTMGEILGIDHGFDVSKLWLFVMLPIGAIGSLLFFRLCLKIGYGKMLDRLQYLIKDIEALKE